MKKHYLYTPGISTSQSQGMEVMQYAQGFQDFFKALLPTRVRSIVKRLTYYATECHEQVMRRLQGGEVLQKLGW